MENTKGTMIYTIRPSSDLSGPHSVQVIKGPTDSMRIENETSQNMKVTRVKTFSNSKTGWKPLIPKRISDTMEHIKSLMESSIDSVKASFCVQNIYGPSILVLAVAATSVFTLWPQNNVIINSEYWYEPIVPYIAGIYVFSNGIAVYDSYLLMKLVDMYSWKTYLKLLTASTVGLVVPYVAIYGV